MRHRLLVAALRCRVTGEQPPSLPDGSAALALRHRARGTLYHIGPRLGEHDAAAVERAWQLNVAGHLARIAALARTWPTDAPLPMVIKGADLAEHLYGDPGARAANDLDLLLPDPYFSAVERRLPTVGRRPPPRYERFADERSIAIGLEVDGVLIEVHRALAPPHRGRLDPLALYRRGRPGALGRIPIRVPTAHDRLVIWLANAAKDAMHLDLAGLLDLALILVALDARASPRWADWRRSAGRLGLRRAWDLALDRLSLSGLWPGPLPVAPVSVRAMARLLPPIEAGRVEPDQVRFQTLKLWLCDRRHRPGIVARGLATAVRRRA